MRLAHDMGEAFGNNAGFICCFALTRAWKMAPRSPLLKL